MDSKGFTLVEILITLGIFALMAGLGLFITMSAYQASVTRSERDLVVALLERARAKAMSNVEQSEWGVCVLERQYVLFKGTACNKNEESETTALGPGVDIEVLGPIEGVAFNQLSGRTASTTLRITQNARTEVVSINYEGAISF